MAVFCFITFAFFMFSMKTFGSMEIVLRVHRFREGVGSLFKTLTEKFESLSDKYPCICFERLSPVNPSK